MWLLHSHSNSYVDAVPYAMSYNVYDFRAITWAFTIWNSQEVLLTPTQAVTALQRDPERLTLLLLSLRFGVTNTKGGA